MKSQPRNPVHAALAVVAILCLAMAAGLVVTVSAAKPNGHYWLRVTPSGTDAGDCADPDNPCATMQYAVDVAVAGDTLKVAAWDYTDLHARLRADVVTTGVVTQTLYISKSVTLRGGYVFPGFPEPPDPESHPTRLLPQGQGRGVYVASEINPVLEGLEIQGGDATGLGGFRSVADRL